MADARDIEEAARKRVPELLRAYTKISFSVLPAAEVDGWVPDFALAGDARIPLMATEVRASGRVGQVAQAADRLRQYAASTGLVPLLVVPFMGAAGAKTALDRDVFYIDLSGNAHIETNGLHVHVEGRPNRYPERGRPSTAFASRSSRVARVLLLDPIRWWRQVDVVRVTRLTSGTVSKVVSRLDEDDLLERREDGAIRPRDSAELLDAWADEYSFDRHHSLRAHLTNSAGIALMRRVAVDLDKHAVEYAMTRLAGAWLLDGFAQFRLVSVYVNADPESVLKTLGARITTRGPNIEVVYPDDVGVFEGAESVSAVAVVAPVQAYLDLLDGPERSADAAMHLRSTRLDWPR